MPLLAKCRKLVGTFKHSTSLSEQLTNTIKTLKLNAKALFEEEDDGVDLDFGLEELINISSSGLKTKLVQDLVTRWNSTLAMLSSVFESHAAIRMVITSDPDIKKKYGHELLSDAELGIVEDLILLLDPFLEMTKLVSGSHYVTSSIVLPAITRLLECLKLYAPCNGNSFVGDIAEAMYDNLFQRTEDHFKNPIMLAATFMDPRYRNLKFIKDRTEREVAIQRAKSYIYNVYKNIIR